MKKEFVKYKDLKNIKNIDINFQKEKLIALPRTGNKTIGKYLTGLNELDLSDKIMVRKSVKDKLNLADSKLKEINSNYQLIVSYGYRALSKQKKYFKQELEKVKDEFINKDELYEYVHEKIAVPEVAGHPTGGAVDIIIYDRKNKQELDFGSKLHDFSSDICYTFNENISMEAKNNRMLLRKIMLSVGFAPYDGEWWHFSYGDKEWAFYYKKEKYLYDVKDEKEVYKNEV